MKYQEIIKKLKSLSNPKNIAGMARFGLSSKTTRVLGVKKPVMDKMAKEVGKNHHLALKLWNSGIYEARILAALVADPNLMTDKQTNRWISQFDNWGVCDNACMHLFDKIPSAFRKAKKWVEQPKEFTRRTGFALMASLAFHNKKAADSEFINFFPLIRKYSTDERNYIRKAVNWALRQIGKRNKNLNKEAVKAAREIAKINNKAARWIAGDAIRELMSPAVQKRL